MAWLIEWEERISQCRIKRKHGGICENMLWQTSPGLPSTKCQKFSGIKRTGASLQGAKIGAVTQINVSSGRGNATWFFLIACFVFSVRLAVCCLIEQQKNQWSNLLTEPEGSTTVKKMSLSLFQDACWSYNEKSFYLFIYWLKVLPDNCICFLKYFASVNLNSTGGNLKADFASFLCIFSM